MILSSLLMDKAKIISGIKKLKTKDIRKCEDERLPLQPLKGLQCATLAHRVLLAHLEACEQEGTNAGLCPGECAAP